MTPICFLVCSIIVEMVRVSSLVHAEDQLLVELVLVRRGEVLGHLVETELEQLEDTEQLLPSLFDLETRIS